MCDTCHKEYGEIDNTNHDTVSHPGKTATCVEAGYNAYVTCTRCDYTTYSELPATGAHTAGDWVTVTEPTETSEGLRTKSCTVCGGEVERETLPMLSTLVYGDVNGDGSINLSDVSKVLQYIAKWEVKDFDPAAADVNGDGKVNLTDASRMLQYIAKWDVVLGK